MNTPQHTRHEERHPEGPRRGRSRVAGWVLGSALIVLGVGVVTSAGAVRAREASLAASAIGHLAGSDTLVIGSRGAFYWGLGSGEPHGLRITGECSSAYVLGPLLAVFGLLAFQRRLPWRRVLLGVAAGGAVVLAVNMGRIVVIADSVQRWNSEAAFWWSHVVVGSVVAVIGNIVALALAIRIAFAGDRAGT